MPLPALALISLSLLAVVVALALINRPALPLQRLTIAVSTSPLSAPVYIAAQRGYFRNQGLAVELIEVPGGNLSFDLMIEGQADLATSSESVVMFRSFERQDFRVLASFVSSDNDVKLLASADGPIRHLRDLAGARVAVIDDSSSEYFLHNVALMHGIDHNEIETLPLQADEMSAALLEQNRVQALSTWEPFGYEVVKALGEKAVVLPGKGLYSLNFNLVTRQDTLQVRADALLAFLKALDQGIEFMHRDPSAAQAIIRTRLGLEPGFINWLWPDYNFRLGMGHSLLISLDSAARWALATGAVAPQPPPDFRRLLDSRLLQQVVPETEGL